MILKLAWASARSDGFNRRQVGNVKTQDMVEEGNNAFARAHLTGTHRGEPFGIAATGRRARYSGAAEISAKFRDLVGNVIGLYQCGGLRGCSSVLQRGAGV